MLKALSQLLFSLELKSSSFLFWFYKGKFQPLSPEAWQSSWAKSPWLGFKSSGNGIATRSGSTVTPCQDPSKWISAVYIWWNGHMCLLGGFLWSAFSCAGISENPKDFSNQQVRKHRPGGSQWNTFFLVTLRFSKSEGPLHKYSFISMIFPWNPGLAPACPVVIGHWWHHCGPDSYKLESEVWREQNWVTMTKDVLIPGRGKLLNFNWKSTYGL